MKRIKNKQVTHREVPREEWKIEESRESYKDERVVKIVWEKKW